jgi:hypothetical protein
MANSPERLEEIIHQGKVLTYRGICNTAKEEGWFLGTDSDSAVTRCLRALNDLGEIEIAIEVPHKDNSHTIIYIIPKSTIDQPAKK